MNFFFLLIIIYSRSSNVTCFKTYNCFYLIFVKLIFTLPINHNTTHSHINKKFVSITIVLIEYVMQNRVDIENTN